MKGIQEAFLAAWKGLRVFWDELLTFVVCNLLWFVLSIPLITAPAATSALYCVADLAARDKRVAVADFFAGFKQYLAKGTLLGLLNVAAGVLLAVNILFYANLASTWADILLAIWIAATIYWLLLQVYLFPMFVVQIEPRISTTIKNATLLVLAQPLFCLTTAIILLMTAALSVVLLIPLLFFGISLIAVLSCVALNDRLDTLGIRKKLAEEGDAP